MHSSSSQVESSHPPIAICVFVRAAVDSASFSLFHLVRIVQCFLTQIHPSKILIFECLPLKLFEALYVLYGHDHCIEALSFVGPDSIQIKVKSISDALRSIAAENMRNPMLVLFAGIKDIPLPNHLESFAKAFEATPTASWGYQKKLLVPKIVAMGRQGEELEGEFEPLHMYGVQEPVQMVSLQWRQCISKFPNQMAFKLVPEDGRLETLVSLQPFEIVKQFCQGIEIATNAQGSYFVHSLE